MSEESTIESTEKPTGRAARQGKIARLPAAIREELNQRLLDGESGAGLVEWLNRLPETEAALQRGFGGRAVTEQNLSDWRQGGFRDWVAKTEAAACLADTLADTPGQGPVAQAGEKKTPAEGMADRVAGWFFPYYVAAARGRMMAAETSEERWSVLRTICRDLAGLRRSEHYLERLKIWWEKLEADSENARVITEKKFIKWARAQENIEQLIWPERKPPTEEERAARIEAIIESF